MHSRFPPAEFKFPSFPGGVGSPPASFAVQRFEPSGSSGNHLLGFSEGKSEGKSATLDQKGEGDGVRIS